MSPRFTRVLSLTAIVVASVMAGVILSADLGWLPQSHAQSQTMVPTAQGPVSAVTLPSFADMADQVMPAVVSIATTEIVRDQGRSGMNPFEFFLPDPRRPPQAPGQPDADGVPQESGGTGFIITEDGYILTNNHVVESADRVQVRYGVGDRERTVNAKVVGRDPATDIAVIKIDVNDRLPTVRLGNSDNIRVGEWAIAIGNPLQFENTLTVGVVSAKGRSLGISQQTSSFEDFIQTDAAINFGNSGGPLLNIRGEVIGINTAIRAYSQGLGFATPINVAKKIYPQLREQGRVIRGYIGIGIDEIDEREMRAFNLPSRDGAIVTLVEPGQPAEKAGLRPGDVVIQIDNQVIRTNRDLIDYVSDLGPGKRITINYLRDGQRRTATATTGERPSGDETPAAAQPSEEDSSSKLGINVQDITPAMRQTYGLPEDAAGVLVTGVRPLSPAADGNLGQGDVIQEVNGRRVSSVAELARIVSAAESGSYLRFYVRTYFRGGQSAARFAVVQIP